jgi:hypothetical protein
MLCWKKGKIERATYQICSIEYKPKISAYVALHAGLRIGLKFETVPVKKSTIFFSFTIYCRKEH